MKLLSGIVVVTFGLCLIALAAVIVIKPLLAERFLKRFASSALTHYSEQTSRLVAGVAIVIFSPSMWVSGSVQMVWMAHHHYRSGTFPYPVEVASSIW